MAAMEVELAHDTPSLPQEAKASGEHHNEEEQASKRSRDDAAAADSSSRPKRERKSVERLTLVDTSVHKEFQILQGKGTPLKEIPNVAYKLSKRSKADEIIGLLHSLLFGKRVKANLAKTNILSFSGYVWGENEEKEKTKAKERLERFTREGLYQLVDLLDLRISKSIKKEEVVIKLFEFLEVPHKTTDNLLTEEKQKLRMKKRKSIEKKKASNSNKKVKSPKSLMPSSGKQRKKEQEKEIASDHDELESESEDEQGSEDDKGSDEEFVVSHANKKANSRRSKSFESQIKMKKTNTLTKESDDEDGTEKSEVVENDKVMSEIGDDEDDDEPLGVVKSKVGKKNFQQKFKTASCGKDELSEKFLDAVHLEQKVAEIVKESDFSKITFTNILDQLGLLFGPFITERKKYVKKVIKQQVTKFMEARLDQDDDPVAQSKDKENEMESFDPEADSPVEPDTIKEDEQVENLKPSDPCEEVQNEFESGQVVNNLHCESPACATNTESSTVAEHASENQNEIL